MNAHTDYPILALGDKSGVKAPIRSCEVLSYDGDKYCTVAVSGVIGEIKRGYIYTEKGRCGEVPVIDVTKLLTANKEE